MNIAPVESLLAQMRTAIAQAEARDPTLAGVLGGATGVTGSVGKLVGPSTSGTADFASVLKASLDRVAQTQNRAESVQQRFVAGDPQVSLSQTMIEMQKANISLQTTIQVRNRLVSAYNDIMNMQV